MGGTEQENWKRTKTYALKNSSQGSQENVMLM